MQNPNPNPQPRRGQYADDPTMREIVERFVCELPERVRVLREALRLGQQGDVLRVVGQLRGGGHGSISARAAELENAVRAAMDERAGLQSAAIRERFDELIELCDRATAGD